MEREPQVKSSQDSKEKAEQWSPSPAGCTGLTRCAVPSHASHRLLPGGARRSARAASVARITPELAGRSRSPTVAQLCESMISH